jgi:hypothetical protein
MNYDNSIYFNWYNAGDSSDFFEFRLVNDYTIGHFSFDMGENSDNLKARKITKNNPYLFIRNYGNLNSVYDIYRLIPSYNINNIYFHWDIMEYDNYVCKMKNITTKNKSRPVLMKEYGLNDMKVYRSDNNNQHCKTRFKN